MIQEYGIFALDPGLSSAYAMGIVSDDGTVAERIAQARELSSHTIKDIDWLRQAKQIARTFSDFRRNCHLDGVPAFLVCEDFILTRFKSSERTGLYPVWVAAAVTGYRRGMADTYELGGWGPAAEVETYWQSPSQAKTFCTDARLRQWNLWVRGKEHERDAWRHFAHFIAASAAQKYRQAHMRAYTRESR